MYNMDISIFGFKLNLEILILIGVIYLILVGHLFCGCCNYNLMEGFDVSGNVDISGNPIKTQLQTNLSTDKTNLSSAKSNLATQVAAGGPTTSTSSTSTSTEGFTGANTNYGQSSPYDLTNDNSVNTSSWSAQNMTVVPGQPLSAGVKDFLARKPQPVPLPEGELFMFANTPFKPECCPNTYSTGSGCACMTSNQYNYLITRGSNNVPYSEY
jgi:hypothetical protein